jgi:hypothetical protein
VDDCPHQRLLTGVSLRLFLRRRVDYGLELILDGLEDRLGGRTAEDVDHRCSASRPASGTRCDHRLIQVSQFPVWSTSRIARGQLDALSTDMAATRGPHKSSGKASRAVICATLTRTVAGENPENIRCSRSRRDGETCASPCRASPQRTCAPCSPGARSHRCRRNVRRTVTIAVSAISQGRGVGCHLSFRSLWRWQEVMCG